MEMWKPLNENYDVSNYGRVRSWIHRSGRRKNPYIMKPKSNDRGYLRVTLKGFSYQQRIHRLVLEVFIGPCPEGMEACHGDGNRANNRLDNLRWDTRSANENDKDQTYKMGENNNQAVLTAKDVRTIRNAYIGRGGPTLKELAQRFEVSINTIHQVVKQKTWKDTR